MTALAKQRHRQFSRALGIQGYLLAILGVALTTLAIAVLRARFLIPNLSILYLFAILALACTSGRRAALFAAILGLFTYNFFFVEPLYTFAVHDPAEWLALLAFLVTALVAGQLAAALRERVEEARYREHIAATLYELSRALVAKQEPELLLAAVAAQVVAVFGVPECAILLPDDTGRLGVRVARTAEGAASPAADSADEDFVNRTFTDAHGPGTEHHGDALFVPLYTAGRCLGVMRIAGWGAATLRTDADERLPTTFAAQAALALEQARLAREETRAEVLSRADAAKDALLASVSHDLRTPLAAIRAAAGSLLQEEIDWDPETRREFAAAIDEEAQRLNQLVGALLDMSRIDAGGLRAHKEYYPLDLLVRSALARIAPLTGGRRLEVDVPTDLPPVPLDPVQIERILGNLLDNALKYSPAGAPIAVAVTVAPATGHDAREVQVSVADRGPGIAPGERERVFDKFSRLHRDTGAPGSGLGLAIARGLVEAHGGRIWVDDRPGGGARFTFALPLPAEPSGPAPYEDADERAGMAAAVPSGAA